MTRSLYKIIMIVACISGIFNACTASDFHGGLGWGIAALMFAGEAIRAHAEEND